MRKKLPVKRIRFENKNQIFRDAEKADRIYLPIGQIDDEIIERWGKKLICELPRLVYPPGEGAL